MNDVGLRESADLRSALHLELAEEGLCLIDALVDGHVDVDALALDGVREAHHRSLGDVGVKHHGALNLCCSDAVAARVDDLFKV